MSNIYEVFDVDATKMDVSITYTTGKSECVESKELRPMDKVDWIVRRILEFGGYENGGNSVKTDIFGLILLM